MTVDELAALMKKHHDAVPDARNIEAHEREDRMHRAVAEWMHIDERGFARADLEFMQLACKIIADCMHGVRRELDDLANAAKDEC